jgi:hypothetical protein
MAQRPTIYFMKHIIHNWSDEKSFIILKHLRDAIGDDTERKAKARVLIVDSLMPYACVGDGNGRQESGAGCEVPGTFRELAKAPLLQNWGGSSLFAYYLDLVVRSIPHSIFTCIN